MANRSLTRRVMFVGIILAAAGACALLLKPAPKTDFEQIWKRGAAEGFNVVVVTLDTTRADRLGCYGYGPASTPVLDGLASDGVRFAEAVSCAPMTLPAHASIFTGMDPPNHGVRSNGLYRLDESHETLAEILAQHGYDTAGFVSAFVLDGRYGLGQGFDLYDDDVSPVAGSHVVQRSGGKVTDAAIKWLDTRSSEKPFFLWVHYFDPHLGYNPPEPYASQFRSRPYDGEIAYMDSQIGRLVDRLREEAEGTNTVVAIVGDHGESLGEHHEQEHSRAIYEATQHVPLMLWSPGIGDQAYLVDDVATSITDISPTVLDLLGIDIELPWDGVSLLDCRAQGDRAVYMETLRTYLDHHWAPLFGLRRLNDKLILAPKPEYYDLSADPNELENLFETVTRSQSEAMGELVKILSERMVRDPSAEALAAMQGAVQPNSEELKRLQALGYVSGGEDSGDTNAEGAPEVLPNPSDMMPVLNLFLEARALRKAGQYQNALEVAQEALEISPADRTLLREVGAIYVRLNRGRDAEKVFRQYLEIKPDADVCWMLAQVLMQTGRSREAQSKLRMALELEPDHGGALISRGDFAAANGDSAKAILLYEQAMRVDPYRAKTKAEARIAKLMGEIRGAENEP